MIPVARQLAPVVRPPGAGPPPWPGPLPASRLVPASPPVPASWLLPVPGPLPAGLVSGGGPSVGVRRQAQAGRGGEHLGLDPVERLVEDHPQVGQRVLADRLGVPGGRPQVARELPGQPLQVTVAAAGGPARARPATPAGTAGPARAACPPWPVTPAAAATAALAAARFVFRLILRLRVLRLRGLLPDVACLTPGVFLPAPATLPARWAAPGPAAPTGPRPGPAGRPHPAVDASCSCHGRPMRVPRAGS